MSRTQSAASVKDFSDRRLIRAHDYRLDGGETEESQPSAQPIAQIASILGRAHLQCIFSALRVGLRATKRLSQGHLRVVDHVMRANPSRGQALRIIVDETRGCLREVSDATSEEIGRLRAELGKLDEEARGIVSEPEPATRPHRRGWKVKP